MVETLVTMHHSDHSIPADEPERTAALASLRAACELARATEFAEIWVDHAGFPSLCCSMNKGRGWLMLIRYESDARFSSRSTDFASSAEKLEFRLANGQVDEVPRAWTLPSDEAMRALVYCAQTSGVPESIKWFNDSGDESTGPNDRRFYTDPFEAT